MVSLHPISPSDVADLVRVHSAAFKTDQFSNFMLDGKPPGTHESLMERSIQTWISDPTSQLCKAVTEDGDIIGWACWLTKDKSQEKNEPARPVAQPNPAHIDKPDPPTRVIGRQMRSDSMAKEAELMTEDKYLVLQAIVVHPDYQRQGIGAMLIQWGVDRAGKERLSCWCHASPAGFQLYFKQGFVEQGNDEYDLGNFGKYMFRYMVRRHGFA
ncbi:acetyltransferase [Penicillium malachiteum]|uniref:Acetyltransferase n=1 Tax=Penicillium malachiteum TaxID=1324776 RepID=A0AAD6HW42_9EURO|nr:acetyltransferase [Penicillium malachiteum]